MPESVIVPPVPTINQGDKLVSEPVDNSPGLVQVQEAFDRIFPDPKVRPTEPKVSAPPEPTKPVEAPKAEIQPSAEPEQPKEQEVPKTADVPADAHKLPSDIETLLKVEPSKEEVKPVEDEWPEELPTFKSSDEAKARYKKWREEYSALKKEVHKTPAISDEQTKARIQFLENQNKEMSTVLSRVGIEQTGEFQNGIIRPMHGAFNAAATIVKQAGGDPQKLASALTLQGKAQFEALDEIFSEMPESAKSAANSAIQTWRQYEVARRQALSEAPQRLEAIRKNELQHQYQILNQQKAEMQTLFDSAVKKLRDDARVEVLQTSSDPESKWWNDQAEQIVNQSKALYLENTDMGKMAMACVLAPMADTYRKLWLAERAAHQKTEKTMNDRFGAEPNLSESSGGNGLPPSAQAQEDLKRPFSEVFLREFHKAQARNR